METIENDNVFAIFDIYYLHLLFHLPESCFFTDKRIIVGVLTYFTLHAINIVLNYY